MGKRLKIMHIITDSKGNNRYFDAHAKAYDREKFEMYFCTFQYRGPIHDEMEAKGVPAFSLNCHTRRQYPVAIFKLYFLLKKKKIDILYAHLIDGGFVGLAAAKLARIPVTIFTRHHSDLTFAGKKEPLFRILDKICSVMADHIIASSQGEKDAVIKEGVPQKKVTLVYYAFDMENFRISSIDAPQRIRQEFSLQDSFVVCTIARLHIDKGHIYLFQAAKDLVKRNDQIKFLLLGEGDLRDYLESLAREMGIQDNVIFAGYRTNVFDILAACDIVVHPTLSEALCQVMIETLSMGKPLIISDVSGVADVVKNYENGIIIPSKDPQAIYDAVLYMMNNPEHAKQMGQSTQNEVRRRFDIKTSIKKLENLYMKWYNEKVFLKNKF